MLGTLTHATATFLPIRKMSYSGSKICRAPAQTAPCVSYTCKATPSLYEVLKVEKNASPIKIKMAYRNLAKVYHPDSLRLNSSDGQDFIEIHEAYSTLSDSAMREVYDMKLGIGSGRSSVNGSGFYRGWETDQCW